MSLYNQASAWTQQDNDQREASQRLVEAIVARLRVEMAALHLGDDMVVTETEAARLLGLHVKTLAKMRRRGDVPSGALGKSPRYSLGMIRAIMRQTQQQ